MRIASLVSVVVLASGLAACSKPQPREASVPDEGIRLTATLATPYDVVLDWKGMRPNAAGCAVEFSTEPQGDWTILQFAPPQQTTYKHPDLIPATTFYYRIRPFFGPVSRPLDVTLPPAPKGENIDAMDHSWAQPQTVPALAAATSQSVRSSQTVAAAAPTDLSAAIMHSSGIKFTWMDHSSDEDGFMLEIKPEGTPEFRVAWNLDANVNSFGFMTLPTEKRATYRIRAFYYGPASNLVQQTSGPEPPTPTPAVSEAPPRPAH